MEPLHKLYFTDRKLPLIATYPRDKPVLTVENYCKWYCLYILNPDGTIEPVGPELIEKIEDRERKSYVADHCFHPDLIHKLAVENNWYICEQGYELVVGRWMTEIEERF